MSTDASGSAALVARILADPPRVHPEAPRGAWATDPSCYELLAARATSGATTLETGCGVSTAVFAARKSSHTCIAWSAAEVDGIKAWCATHDVPADQVTFVVGGSQHVLPVMDPAPLDLVFIDGEHTFPLPVIDWYYTAVRLRVGALLVIDDIQLPAPRLVADYVGGLSVFAPVRRTGKWAAFELFREPPPADQWERPAAGASLVASGRFERLGRRLDRLVDNLLDKPEGAVRGRAGAVDDRGRSDLRASADAPIRSEPADAAPRKEPG